MNSQVSPTLAKILNECFAVPLPLATSRRWVPIRECVICRTSDAATQAGSRYCENCLADGTAEALEEMTVGETLRLRAEAES